MFSHQFRVRERTRNSDWLISHQGFPNYIPCGFRRVQNSGLSRSYIDEVLVISDIHLATDHCIQLKEEQDKAVRDLLKGKYVFAVLPTGYGKSLIYQAFVRAREYQTSGKAAIIVISPLNSIYIKDQLKDMERQCFSSVDA
jgi:hypothetical protein